MSDSRILIYGNHIDLSECHDLEDMVEDIEHALRGFGCKVVIVPARELIENPDSVSEQVRSFMENTR